MRLGEQERLSPKHKAPPAVTCSKFSCSIGLQPDSSSYQRYPRNPRFNPVVSYGK